LSLLISPSPSSPSLDGGKIKRVPCLLESGKIKRVPLPSVASRTDLRERVVRGKEGVSG